MAENNKSIDGIVERLALIVEATDTLFPDGKMAVLFALNETDFKRVQENFREVDRGHKQFKIDISGTEFIFLQETSLTDEKDKI
jgi:hypothetical protein